MRIRVVAITVFACLFLGLSTLGMAHKKPVRVGEIWWWPFNALRASEPGHNKYWSPEIAKAVSETLAQIPSVITVSKWTARQDKELSNALAKR